MALPPPSSVVSLLTDFGGDDPYVGIMKGALLRAHRAAVIVDVTHAVPPQDVAAASFHVAALPDRFPAGTVHVAVVDPGVGTDRRALAVSAADAYWIAPDNGVLEPVLARPEAEVVAIDAERLRLGPLSRTFHGRDLFAPVAGMLARGTFGFRALGPRITDPVRRSDDPAPRVVFVDHFGNLVTNVPDGVDVAALTVAGTRCPVVTTYGEAGGSEPVALVGSFGSYEVAVAGGSAAARLDAAVGAAVTVHPRGDTR